MTVDTLVVNGRIFGAADGATALAVASNRIVAIGSDAAVGARRRPSTEVVDAAGGSILPGFDDAHMHLRLGAAALDQLDLFGVTGLPDVQARIGRYADERPEARWVLGRGWMYAAFAGGLPTREQLDAVVPDRPAFLMCFDAHSAWANSRALEAAGIDRSTPDPPNGRIVRDERGEPTGALLERAAELVQAVLPATDDDERLRLTAKALDALARSGITSAQDAWAEPGDFELLVRLRDRGGGRLPVRLRLAPELRPTSGSDLAAQLDAFDELALAHPDDPFLRTGILKSFLDGVVEARTAYLLEPYPGTDSRGDRRWADEELLAAVAEAHLRGWQLELHAIGTAAVRQALDAYEALGKGEARRRRHRIEHIETIEPDDLPRFAELGVVASMQPFHAIPDSSQTDTWRSALPARLADAGWPIRSLLRSGAALCFGSDWPVVPFDPFLEIHAAVNRRWLPAERISLDDALGAATVGGAYAAHAEKQRGRLAPGMLADVVVLDRHLAAAGASAILGTTVRLTMVDGRIVHRLV